MTDTMSMTLFFFFQNCKYIVCSWYYSLKLWMVHIITRGNVAVKNIGPNVHSHRESFAYQFDNSGGRGDNKMNMGSFFFENRMRPLLFYNYLWL